MLKHTSPIILSLFILTGCSTNYSQDHYQSDPYPVNRQALLDMIYSDDFSAKSVHVSPRTVRITTITNGVKNTSIVRIE